MDFCDFKCGVAESVGMLQMLVGMLGDLGLIIVLIRFGLLRLGVEVL